jgi:hypothetical protein
MATIKLLPSDSVKIGPSESLNRKTQEQSPVKHNVIYRQAGIRAQFRGGDTFKLG